MKVLITGSSGFIGTNLIGQLTPKHKVTLWDKKMGFDIFNHELKEAIQKVDVVIHLAAITSVEKSFTRPEEVFRTNVLGTARVIEACQRYDKKLIFPSSAAIYQPDSSPYAKSKWMAEQLVAEYGNSVILRLFNVYGKHMNPKGESVMYNFLHNKKLVVYGDGRQTRDFINVKDVVRIMEDAFKHKWTGKTVDVGIGYTYTINHIAKLVSKMRNIEIEYLSPRQEIRYSVSDNRKLKELYKKKMLTNIEKDIYEI